MAAVMKERVDFDKDAEPSLWTTALMTATSQWLHSSVGFGVTQGKASKPEELESMSTGIGFNMLAQAMARNVGSIETDETVTDYMKRAVATTAPVVNSLIQWKAGAQRRVTKFLKEQPKADDSKPLSRFTVGETVAASSSAMDIFDAAGNQLVYDEAADNFVPVNLDTAFDSTVWDAVEGSRQAPVSALQETVTGAHQSSADFGGSPQVDEQ